MPLMAQRYEKAGAGGGAPGFDSDRQPGSRSAARRIEAARKEVNRFDTRMIMLRCTNFKVS